MLMKPSAIKRQLNQQIIDASWMGQDVKVQDALLQAADVNARDKEHQETPLMLAAERGLISIVKILIENGASTDNQDMYGRTALIHAASAGKSMVARLLIEAGSDVNVTDKYGVPVLSYAVESGDLLTVRTLIDAGVEVNAMDQDGETALAIAKRNADSAIVNLINTASSIS